MSDKKVLPTQERLRELLDYDRNTGNLIWRKKPDELGLRTWNTRFAGKIAGRKNKKGYIQVSVDYHMLYAHRVIWTWVYGDWPPEGFEIDHVNGDRSDNRISNLRLATRIDNSRNIRKANMYGLKGVKFDCNSGLFTAEIRTSEGRYSLGYYKTPEEAHAAYCGAAKIAHGAFACLDVKEVNEHA